MSASLSGESTTNTGRAFRASTAQPRQRIDAIVVLVIVVVLALIGAAMSVRVVKQYEQGVLFRLGRVLGARTPGLRLIVPFVDVLHRVSLRIAAVDAVIAWHYPDLAASGYGMAAVAIESADDFRESAGKIVADAISSTLDPASDVPVRARVA